VRDLFRGYNKLIRPVQNMTEKVDVRFGLAFVQLINVVGDQNKPKKKKLYSAHSNFQNEKNQIMKSNVWLRLVSKLPPLRSKLRFDSVCRCGTTISFSGTKLITEELLYSGYPPTKSGNLI
jgi:hypothetical protein